ncbi:hypothetical protein J1N35_038549 [Gossypium stocksii]|uniref:Uncharacterized protein n=1 Tax=Gossypium stocksii TaxID=47602 RepID=A0A9D3ZN01_9ROSI|nr:hypothetical protein J1N35_038549 [Gossypium stocksii]
MIVFMRCYQFCVQLTKNVPTTSVTYLSNSGHKHMTAAYDMLPTGVVVAPAGILVHLAGDLVVGVGRMTHLDRIVNTEVFASPMAEVFESHKAMRIGKKKSSLTAPRVIPRTTAAYRSAIHLK